MASYSTVKYGSRGEDVIRLQMALNSAGYDLDEDGIFGTKTQQAVRDYQASKGLTVDGIVGANTWGALNTASSSSSANKPTDGGDAANDSALTAQLESLIAQFNNTPGYTPKTDEEIRAQAEGEYKSYYDQLRLAEQQKHAQGDLALSQQRDKLADVYQQQKDASEKEYAEAYSAADRQMLSRGMQRSSYAAQTLANIDTQGAQAQQAIADAQARAEGDVDEQRAQLAQQLAAQLAQYDAGYAADVLNRIRELEDQEYERSQDAADRKNSLSLQIYELMYQQERDKIADQQWQQQFDENVRQFNVSASKKSSGSGSKSSSSSQQPAADANAQNVNLTLDYNWLVSALGGGQSSTSGSVNSGGVDAIAGAAPKAQSSAATTMTTPSAYKPAQQKKNGMTK